MPEGLDPKYWDGSTGLKIADYLKDSLPVLSAHAARQAAIPEKPEGYELKLPEDFKPPQGVEIKFDDKDPRIPLARTVAKELGLGQDGFSKLLALDAQIQLHADQALQAVITAESAKLGDKFPARKAAVEAFLTANVGEDGLKALMPQVRSAAAFEALEKLIAKAAATGVPGSEGSPPAPPKPAEVPMKDRWYGGSQQKAS